MNFSPLSLERQSLLLAKLAVLGGFVLAIGVPFATERIWSNLLVITFFAVTLALGSVVFIALAYVCGASWNVAFRRIPEAIASTLPVTGFGLLIVLLLGRETYGWHYHGEGDPGTFWFKQWWANLPFWTMRSVAYLAIWIMFCRTLVSVSRRQDQSGDYRLTILNQRLSAVFLVVFAITFSMASWDWLMLLEPMWFSTIWGVYNFAGMIQATLATTILLALVLRSHGGPLCSSFTDDHLHDLGKLLLGFSCFWMYLWFSQYMLIWYGNIPEETAYFVPRTDGPWGPILVASIVLNWIIPFFVLLPRSCKRSGSVIAKIAIVVLVGRWVDLYTIVFPATIGDTPVFGIWEIAAVACLVGTCGWLFLGSFSRAAPIPNGDPLLDESLRYHC